MITVYTYDSSGYYSGTSIAQVDPTCEQGNTILLPPNTTQWEPPSYNPSTQIPKWNGAHWELEVVMPPPASVPTTAPSVADSSNKPEVGANETAIVVDGQWKVVPDYRGTSWKLADGSLLQINDLNVTPPEGAVSADTKSLADVKTAQLAALEASYMEANSANIAYQKNQFQADGLSERLLQSAVLVYGAAGAVPTGFFWQAADNSAVSFKLADLQALLAAIVDRRWTNFQRLQQLKSEVEDANTADAVTSITW